MINIALSPNLQKEDVSKALRLLFQPWKWKKGSAVSKLEESFAKYFGQSKSFSVSSGRGALYLILKALNFKEADEIILQSFTCMVVVNAIKWNNLLPVYADIDEENYNLTLDSIKEKISPNTKAVIIQHTFGIPAPELKDIKEYCKSHKLILIEDCAHAMGATFKGDLVGTFGDFSFFSLGRSKVISCVSGGMILCNNQKYFAKLQHLYANLPSTPFIQIKQNLFHFPVTYLAKKFYNTMSIGKIILVMAQKLHIINLEVTASEKKSLKPKRPVAKLANAQAEIALQQFKKLDVANHKRKFCANFYYEHLAPLMNQKKVSALDPNLMKGAIFLRYPIRLENPLKIFAKAKSKNIILGDWYKTPIAPPDINKDVTNYHEKDCPLAEKVCSSIINLPTYNSLTKTDLENIIKILNQ